MIGVSSGIQNATGGMHMLETHTHTHTHTKKDTPEHTLRCMDPPGPGGRCCWKKRGGKRKGKDKEENCFLSLCLPVRGGVTFPCVWGQRKGKDVLLHTPILVTVASSHFHTTTKIPFLFPTSGYRSLHSCLW